MQSLGSGRYARRRIIMGALAIALAFSSASAQDVTSRELSDTTENIGLPRADDAASADLLSSFHGLDALPTITNLLCWGARGKTGMPVIFSTEIDIETLQAGDFQVETKSGRIGEMHCATMRPATDPGELRTVLLIGDLGKADTDPPVSVEIVGHLHSIDGRLDFKGASIEVTPLANGPSLIYAKTVEDWRLVGDLGIRLTRGSLCPEEGILQAVRVTWAGGVTLPDGSEPGATERDLYRVEVEAADGSRRTVTPAALADLGDNDNNHMLCLDTTDSPISVSFPAGILTDPNNDLNPATSVSVSSPE